LRGLSGSKS